MVGNWYQQFMPSIGSKVINDIVFLDSLTGFAIASKNVNPDTSSIFKTTNGGDNWQIIFNQGSRRFSRVKFINSITGYISAGSGSGTPYLYKSTDGGNNWFTIPGATLGTAYWNDMSVLNEDTIWLVDANSLNGGVFRTTNGGVNWTNQFSSGNQNPNKIYMYNARIGFMSNSSALPNIYKTTNSGVSWSLNLSGENFTDMYFTDSLSGWKCMPGFIAGDSCVKKTTNSGLTWMKQQLPFGGMINLSQIVKFSFVNRDTIWGVGGSVLYSGGRFRGILYRTINGGTNWLFQVPDTSFGIVIYGSINFINKNTGWAYNNTVGIHTTNGGDTGWLTGIKQISNGIPKEFKLYQNYPNPFNPLTKIKYQIPSNKYVNLIVFDITGKQVIDLVNRKQTAGTYEVDFSGTTYSSGVYFYSLIIDGKVIDSRKMILIK
jgi:photosystem II stability/assembly factor-like uncharacterized protein